MALTSRKILRTSITIILIVVVLGIILYPKFKPMLSSDSGNEQGSSGRVRGMRGGGQPLFASGYVIIPTSMNELIYSTGSLIPDEEVELSFEASGKVVGIYFAEGARIKKGQLLAKINDQPLQAQLLKLKAQHKLTQDREFRQRQLLDRDAISRESCDQVATELQSLDADIKLVEARISETELRAPFDGIIGLRFISEGDNRTTHRI
jgi:membrane fusion protein, multidrug efflux system